MVSDCRGGAHLPIVTIAAVATGLAVIVKLQQDFGAGPLGHWFHTCRQTHRASLPTPLLSVGPNFCRRLSSRVK